MVMDRLVQRALGVLSPAARVRDHWGREAGSWHVGRGVEWTEVPAVVARINRRVSGDPAVDPYLHAIRTHFAGRTPVARCLTLGCGAGELERGLAQYGFAVRHEAVDIAADAIATARAAAEQAGLTHLVYRVADCNRIELEEDAYDAVFGVFSIHHVSELEHLFTQVRRGLKSDGLLVLNEYVGPSRFQWTRRQVEVINGLLRVIPLRLRRHCARPHRVKRRIVRHSPARIALQDPSESVRSAEILPLLHDTFEVVELKPYGGTILQSLLHDIAGHFDTSDSATLRLLDAIMDLEEALIAAGELDSDFAFAVARRRPA